MKLYLFVLSFVKLTCGVIINIPELGHVQGTITKSAWTERTIYQFFSIKYATSPSGYRRFMPPEEFPAWYGVYDATVERPGCPELFQEDELNRRNPADDLEDCLTLNVFTPKIPENNKTLLPVMVYIHGGAFFMGNAKPFPPTYLLENDVVLIVIQYRLGVLGFLSLHTDGVPGNAGLMDQVLALNWINKYIKNFNGDNERVTVFGQSSGACSISMHLLSPMVRPNLFQQVILQSGSSFGKWAIEKDPLSLARGIYSFLINDTNHVEVPIMEKKFKEISVVELFKAVQLHNEKRDYKITNLMLKPVVQIAGTVKYLTKSPGDCLRAGEFRTLPMMLGVCKNDGSYITTMFYDYLEKMGVENNDEFLRNNLTSLTVAVSDFDDDSGALSDIIENKYFKKVFNQAKKLRFADISTGMVDILDVFNFKATTLKQAKVNSHHQPNSTFLYSFDYRGLNTRFGYGADTSKYPFDGGISHDNDLLYLFPYHYTKPLNHNDTEMAKLMTDLWTNFAINGKPSSARMNVDWIAMKKNEDGPYLHINSVPHIGNDFVENEYFTSV